LSKNSSICGFNANSAFSLGSYARLLSTALNASFKAFSASISKRFSSTLLNLSSFMMFARRLNVEKFSLKLGSLEILASARKVYAASDGSVREAPFWVLVGALMPAVLVEIGYITHPVEGEKLFNDAYQNALANGIANGIDGYFTKNR